METERRPCAWMCAEAAGRGARNATAGAAESAARHSATGRAAERMVAEEESANGRGVGAAQRWAGGEFVASYITKRTPYTKIR